MTTPNPPAYVVVDGEKWHVAGPLTIGGRPGFDLLEPITKPGMPRRRLFAFISECEQWLPGPRKRRIKDDGYVLEIEARSMTIREKGARTRYPVSLEDIFAAAVWAHVTWAKFEKQKRKH